jgi:hypothetical protein
MHPGQVVIHLLKYVFITPFFLQLNMTEPLDRAAAGLSPTYGPKGEKMMLMGSFNLNLLSLTE